MQEYEVNYTKLRLKENRNELKSIKATFMLFKIKNKMNKQEDKGIQVASAPCLRMIHCATALDYELANHTGTGID